MLGRKPAIPHIAAGTRIEPRVSSATPSGAIPMATATVLHYHLHGRSLEGFFVRKQVKDHGSQQRVEGVVQRGFRVAVIDDVFTQGSAVSQAIAEVERLGAEVVAVSCIVDRLEGARERLAPRYNYLPIFTICDLGIEPPAEGEP